MVLTNFESHSNLLKTRCSRYENNHTEILDICQATGELIEDYLSRVERVSVGSTVSETLLVDIAVKGLTPDLRSFVLGKESKDLTDLRDATILAEKQLNCTSSIERTNNSDLNLNKRTLFGFKINNLEQRPTAATTISRGQIFAFF